MCVRAKVYRHASSPDLYIEFAINDRLTAYFAVHAGPLSSARSDGRQCHTIIRCLVPMMVTRLSHP